MGVFVIGMHRSGTSAVTELLASGGLTVGSSDALMQPTPQNERGYFELTELRVFNDQILKDVFGGWALAPPEPPLDQALLLRRHRTSARRLFETLLPRDGNWVWKDPRNCLLLQFWRRWLKGPHLGILVLRHPAAISASLKLRDDIEPATALALWERHLRSAVTQLHGLPVETVWYDELLEQPVETADRLLTSCEQSLDGFSRSRHWKKQPPVYKELRHHISDEGLPSPFQELLQELHTLPPSSSVFQPTISPNESPLTQGLLAERSSQERIVTDLEAEVDTRGQIIDELKTEVDTRATALADLEAEVNTRGQIIDELVRHRENYESLVANLAQSGVLRRRQAIRNLVDTLPSPIEST